MNKRSKKVSVGAWKYDPKAIIQEPKRRGRKPRAATEIELGNATAAPDPSEMKVGTISSVRMALPKANFWLQVTGQESGSNIFIPLPIRLITQLSETEGGCIVRGAHGDEVKTKENILQILDRLNGFPLRSASVWSLAT